MTKKLLIKFKNIISPYHKGETLLISIISILKRRNSNPQKTMFTVISRLRTGIKVLNQIRAGRVIPLPGYQREDSGNYWAIKWLLKAARERTSKSLTATHLAEEMKDALKKRGRAYKSRTEHVKEIRAARVNLRKSFRRFKKFKKFVPKHKTRIFRLKVKLGMSKAQVYKEMAYYRKRKQEKEKKRAKRMKNLKVKLNKTIKVKK